MTEGLTFDVDNLNIEDGATVEFSKVLFFSDGDNNLTGTPVVDGAKVVAKCQGSGLGVKVRGLRFKAKTRAHTRVGGRAVFTRLKIESITGPAK